MSLSSKAFLPSRTFFLSCFKSDLIKNAQELNGVRFISAQLELDPKSIKELAFEIEREMDDLFMILGAQNDGKATLTVIISKNITQEKDLNAGKMVRELGKYIQGGGGGQPHFATAGGKNPQGISQALEQAKEYLK